MLKLLIILHQYQLIFEFFVLFSFELDAFIESLDVVIVHIQLLLLWEWCQWMHWMWLFSQWLQCTFSRLHRFLQNIQWFLHYTFLRRFLMHNVNVLNSVFCLLNVFWYFQRNVLLDDVCLYVNDIYLLFNYLNYLNYLRLFFWLLYYWLLWFLLYFLRLLLSGLYR